jgi:hypothetical protein
LFYKNSIHFFFKGTPSTNTNENEISDEDKQKQQSTTNETEQKSLPPRDYENKEINGEKKSE